jgi:hypothetical protein
VRLAIIADTHMPKGNRRLPEECVARLRATDLIIHAGDLVGLQVLRELEAYAPVVAVHGNMDDADIRLALPATAQVEAGGAKLAVIHDAGPARGRAERLRTRFPEADAVVFGHSHIPLRERAPDGFQIFNPGSPTERRRSPHRTMGAAAVHDGKPEFELVVLG